MFKREILFSGYEKKPVLTPSAVVPFLPAERKLEGGGERSGGGQGGSIDETGRQRPDTVGPSANEGIASRPCKLPAA